MSSQFAFEEQHQQPPTSNGKRTRCFCVLCNKSETSNEWHVLSIRRSSHGGPIAAMLGVRSLVPVPLGGLPSAVRQQLDSLPPQPGVWYHHNTNATRQWFKTLACHKEYQRYARKPNQQQQDTGQGVPPHQQPTAKLQDVYRFDDNVTSSSSSSGSDGSEDDAESSHDNSNSNNSSEQEGEDNSPSGSSSGGSDMEVEGDDDAPEPSPPSPNNSRGAGRGRGQGRGNGTGAGGGRGRGAQQSGGKRAQPEGVRRSSRDPKRSKT